MENPDIYSIKTENTLTLYNLSIILRSLNDENYFDDFKNKNGIENIITYTETLFKNDINIENKSIQMIIEMLCNIFNTIFIYYNNNSNNEDIMFIGMRILSIFIPEIIVLLGKLNDIKYIFILYYIIL